MEGMLFHITDEFGHRLADPMMISWGDIYEIKQTFICEVQYGQIILY
jgi:hypothetical protein